MHLARFDLRFLSNCATEGSAAEPPARMYARAKGSLICTSALSDRITARRYADH